MAWLDLVGPFVSLLGIIVVAVSAAKGIDKRFGQIEQALAVHDAAQDEMKGQLEAHINTEDVKQDKLLEGHQQLLEMTARLDERTSLIVGKET